MNLLKNQSIFNVVEYGAVGDGKSNDTEPIRRAVESCVKQGGGIIYFPSGKYLTGAIILGSNVTLEICSGATILGSEDPNDYLLVKEETINGSKLTITGLIHAEDAENIAIVGRGTIDGQGRRWWELHWKGQLSHGRPKLIDLKRCTNVTIRDLTLKNSPFWTVHPFMCNDVTIENLRIINPPNSPNTDGINPDSCRNVRISNCYIDVGDDCIAIKAGTELEPYRADKPSENISITNCIMIHGHGGVVMGSETSGSIRNVVVSNCIFNNTDRGVRIKTRRGRGGTVENVRVNNVLMNKVFCPFVVNMFYATQLPLDNSPLPITGGTPSVRKIYLSNITAQECSAAAGFLYGLPEMPIEDIVLSNVIISMGKDPTFQGAQPAMIRGLPKMICSGFYCRNVRGLEFNNVKIIGVENDATLKLEFSEGVKIEGVSIKTAAYSYPAIELRDVKHAIIRGCSLYSEVESFVRIGGANSKDIVVGENQTALSKRMIDLSGEVDRNSIKVMQP